MMDNLAAKNACLTAQNIAMGFGGIVLFRGINLQLLASQCLIIKGANGAGKTTLLRGVMGLLPVLEGAIHIGGINPHRDPIRASQQCIYIGHSDGLAPRLTVMESLQLWAEMRGVRPNRETVLEALAKFGTAPLAHTPIATLSAGQRRRVVLSRLALMGRLALNIAPRLLWVLDEPVTALDDTATRYFIQLLEGHCQSGGSALLTSHNDLPISTAKIYHLGENLGGEQ